VVGLSVRREMARYLQQEYQVSERRCCKVLCIARSTQRRQAGRRYAELIKRLIELVGMRGKLTVGNACCVPEADIQELIKRLNL